MSPPVENLVRRVHAKRCAKGWLGKCPAHQDQRPSLSIDEGVDGRALVKCWAGCTLDAILSALGLTKKDLFSPATLPKPTGNGELPDSTPTATSFDWQNCKHGFTDKQAGHVAKWRGFSPEFVKELRDNGQIGIYDGLVAFPVSNGDGNIVGTHFRLKSGKWNYAPKGIKAAPLIFGQLVPGEPVQIFESTWDGLDYIDKSGERDGVIITRGAGNAALAVSLITEGSTLYLWTQNDAAGENWQRDICTRTIGTVKRVQIPGPYKDLNDWTRGGATADDLLAAIKDAEIISGAKIEVVESNANETDSNATPQPSSFPLDALNPIMREIAQQSAAVYQIKPELPGMAAVAVLAGATGKAVVVSGAVSGRETHCNVYVVAGAPKSYGKNAAASIASPLLEASSEMAKSFRESEKPKLMTEKKVSEKREHLLLKDCTTGDVTESAREQMHVEIAAIQKRSDEVESLLKWPPTYWLGNATSAALTEILKRNGEAILSFSPEAGELVRIALGKFTKDNAADFDLFLSGYTVECARETRISRGDSGDFVPCITALWFCQPFLLRELFTNDEALERGLTARVLPFVVEHEGDIPEDDGTIRRVNESARKEWDLLGTASAEMARLATGYSVLAGSTRSVPSVSQRSSETTQPKISID